MYIYTYIYIDIHIYMCVCWLFPVQICVDLLQKPHAKAAALSCLAAPSICLTLKSMRYCSS